MVPKPGFELGTGPLRIRRSLARLISINILRTLNAVDIREKQRKSKVPVSGSVRKPCSTNGDDRESGAPIVQQMNETAKHVGRCGKSMKEQDSLSIPWARFAIKDVETIDFQCPVVALAADRIKQICHWMKPMREPAPRTVHHRAE